MARDHDRPSTSALAYDPRPALGTWYLIVSGDGSGLSSRVVQLPETADLVLGRDADVDLPIEHDSVSRRHARIRRRGDQITVEDLGSRNGTLVNGQPTAGARRLGAGDVIRVGPAQAIVATSTPVRHGRMVATVTELEDRLAAEVDRAVRYHRPLGLVMLRLEGPVELMTEHAEQLLRSLRRMDVIAEYGADELAIVLPETDRDATAAVTRRANTVPVGLTASTGSATYPEDGSHVGELIGVARDRLRGLRRTPGAPQPVIADPLMKQVIALAQKVAPSMIPVLIVGEPGVGKEVIAEVIHKLGPRRAGPFIKQSCAAILESVIEADLPRWFAAARGGTLFLDEVGELPINTQASLLHALDHQDVRVICASHRDLPADAARGRFRSDLFARVSAFSIPVPPLRDRPAEIEPLALHFLKELSKTGSISDEALAVLAAYAWPGNVRELRNALERALVMSGGTKIEPHHLPERTLERYIGDSGARPQIDVRARVAEVEREAVIDALEATNNNQTRAAKKLGISRFALIRLMDKHDLR
ncbi:MAG: sigma 54-interacting transcriptional regulator [Deltaproteobacteria bacterium]|nr:sigma 54-interacting transcriptional regulator [Deltaproteobacteria bacterium]